MWIPESPRWLAIHGREAEGETVVAGIEQRFRDAGADLSAVPQDAAIRLVSRTHTPLAEAFDALFVTFRLRALVGLALMAAQAFFYNAIFFTYALVLTQFYGVASEDVGWYILPFAIGNFLGPVALGPLFDTLGRRLMISVTYALSGVLLLAAGFVRARASERGAPRRSAGWSCSSSPRRRRVPPISRSARPSRSRSGR